MQDNIGSDISDEIAAGRIISYVQAVAHIADYIGVGHFMSILQQRMQLAAQLAGRAGYQDLHSALTSVGRFLRASVAQDDSANLADS